MEVASVTGKGLLFPFGGGMRSVPSSCPTSHEHPPAGPKGLRRFHPHAGEHKAALSKHRVAVAELLLTLSSFLGLEFLFLQVDFCFLHSSGVASPKFGACCDVLVEHPGA